MDHNNYILHRLAWENNYEEIIKNFKNPDKKIDIEAKDPRGRTALHLAVTLNNFESVRELLKNGASVLSSHGGWTVLQEAISTKNDKLLRLLMHYYYTDCLKKTISLVSSALEDMNNTPDFYTEIHWNVKTWLPFLTRFCPHDDVKIWKSKACIRFDSCLAGMGPKYDMLKGDLSYIIRIRDDKQTIELDHIMHNSKQYVRHIIKPLDILNALLELGPSEHFIDNAMKSPNVSNGLDNEKREFKRFQKGFFTKSDLSEYINGHYCDVFDTSRFNFTFISRTEHLEIPQSKSYLSSMMGLFRWSQTEELPPPPQNPHNPCDISSEEYFNPNVDLADRDIGRIKRLKTETSNFPARFWLCKDYSHLIAAQFKPFLELMTMFASDAEDINDVLLNKWPSGFPMKIQIPLMHVANFAATFNNVNALDREVTGITYNFPDLKPQPNLSSVSSEDLGLGDKQNMNKSNQSPPRSVSSSPLTESRSISDSSLAIVIPKPVDPITIDPGIFVTSQNYQMKLLVEWTKEKVIPLIEEKCAIDDSYMKSSGLVTGMAPKNSGYQHDNTDYSPLM